MKGRGLFKMKIEEALFSHLRNYIPLAGLVGERIYPLVLPRGSALPALTYQKISQTKERTLGNSSKITRARFQVSCWAASYAEGKEVAAQVQAALQDYCGLMGGDKGVQVLDVNVVGERDIYESDASVYHLPLDVMIIYYSL